MEKIMLFSGATIKETFDDFMLSRKTKGLFLIIFIIAYTGLKIIDRNIYILKSLSNYDIIIRIKRRCSNGK